MLINLEELLGGTPSSHLLKGIKTEWQIFYEGGEAWNRLIEFVLKKFVNNFIKFNLKKLLNLT